MQYSLPAPMKLPPPPSDGGADASSPSDSDGSAVAELKQPVEVMIGTSDLAQSQTFVRELVAMVNSAYGYGRISEGEASHRLRAGDSRLSRNRVLHVAMREGKLVGCCSSTLHVPWQGPGCGHWGLLVVDPATQGTGVASALVHAAEARLSDAGCYLVGMEYSFRKGDPFSERLLAWYEDRLHYRGPQHRQSGFRMCRKRLDRAEVARVGALQQRQWQHSLSPLALLQSCVLMMWVSCRWVLAILLWIFCGSY